MTALSELFGINKLINAAKIGVKTGEKKYTTLDKYLKKQNIIFETVLTSDSPTIVADGLDLNADGLNYSFELIGNSATDSQIDIIFNDMNVYRTHAWGSNKGNNTDGNTNAYGQYNTNNNSINGWLMTVNSAVPFRLAGNMFKLTADSNLISYSLDYYYSNGYSTVLGKIVAHSDIDTNITKMIIKQRNGGNFRAGTKLVIRKI